MLAAIPVLVLLIAGLPLLGVYLAGRPLAPYLEFPPVTEHVAHAPFSWAVFSALAMVIAVFVLPALVRIATVRTSSPRMTAQRSPWWTWLGLGLVVLLWPLAWTRAPWFEPWQPFTFTPLWLGYILIINGLTYRRTGHCLLTDRPAFLIALFPASAAFWWTFEYLNRFVQNWYYVGVPGFTAAEYVVHATLSFSTVLPAVFGTIDWLRTSPRLDAAFRDLPALPLMHRERLGWALLIVACAGLAGIGIWSDYLFSLLWISPLLILIGLQLATGRETVFDEVRHGDWRSIGIPALAALQCGFFWELWNSHSLAHWRYAIPYVHRFQIFEMPLLGYAGYLPFGLECYVVGGLLACVLANRGLSHASRRQTVLP